MEYTIPEEINIVGFDIISRCGKGRSFNIEGTKIRVRLQCGKSFTSFSTIEFTSI